MEIEDVPTDMLRPRVDMNTEAGLTCMPCGDDGACPEDEYCVTLDAEGEDRRCFKLCNDSACEDNFACCFGDTPAPPRHRRCRAVYVLGARIIECIWRGDTFWRS